MSAGAYIAVGLALGGGLGLLIGWLLGRGGKASPDGRLEAELRQQISQRESDLALGREQLSQSSTARATAEAQKAAAEKMLAEQRQMHDQNLREARQTQEKAIT